jgi:MFS family permease
MHNSSQLGGLDHGKSDGRHRCSWHILWGILSTTKIILLFKRAGCHRIMTAAFGLTTMVGSFIGSALTDCATWRWCFGINLLGVVIIGDCALFVRIPHEIDGGSITMVDKLTKLDFLGIVLMIGSLISLLMVL